MQVQEECLHEAGGEEEVDLGNDEMSTNIASNL